MLVEAYQTPDKGFHWLDIYDPTVTELEYISKTYNLNPASVRDCLTPQHLPKYEATENYVFVIFRAFDERSRNSGTIRGLTRKVVIFIGENYLITVHRNDPPYIIQTRNTWIKEKKNLEGDPLSRIFIHIAQGVLSTYSNTIYHCERNVEEFENKIFKDQSTQASIQQKFMLKRKISVIKHMLKMSLDLLSKLKAHSHLDSPLFQEMQEFAEGQYFSAGEVLDNVNNLINLQLSLASHQTSEVMRVLTLFTVFIMPMSFISSFYGMNFKHMPELGYKYAYPIVIAVMFSIACTLFWWFKRKKWIKGWS